MGPALCEAMKKANAKCEVITSSSRSEATRRVRKKHSKEEYGLHQQPDEARSSGMVRLRLPI
jgi:hypothetical protein